MTSTGLVTTMVCSLTREPTGNVVLRSDHVALRFFHRFGATPLQWFSEPWPCLTNDFAGSGVSVYYHTGQDSTQATANGPMENPIHIFDNPGSQKYGFYAREYLFDGDGKYGVEGFAPDFWASLEAPDDAIAPDPLVTDSGWRTPYQPGKFGAILHNATTPVVFEGSSYASSGIMLVADELGGGHWAGRLREYAEGRLAFKTTLSLRNAPLSVVAGFLFRKAIPANAATKHDAYAAPGYHLFFNRSGGYSLIRKGANGVETILTNGFLSQSQNLKLLGDGLQVEVRTHNGRPGYLEIWLDDLLAKSLTDPAPLLGPHAGLFASCPSGYVVFSARQFFDIGLKYQMRYEARPGGVIISDAKITLADGALTARCFYRALLPGVFLNPATFPVGQRACYGIEPDGSRVPISGQLVRFMDYQSFWAGNPQGTVGLWARPDFCRVDCGDSPGHALVDANGANGEFVLMLNPLAPNQTTMAKEIRMRATWMTRIP